jgi:hypothetical protein
MFISFLEKTSTGFSKETQTSLLDSVQFAIALPSPCQTLSDYDANLAFNTATAFLRKSDLANYLIDQLEQQHVKINLEVSADPALADRKATLIPRSRCN